jgi:single-strand DNA-binding protein
MQDHTTWFRVSVWGRQAEVANQYLTKGKPIYIEGRLRQEEFTDKDGKARTSLEVMATDLQFIGSRSDDGTASGHSGEAASAKAAGKSDSADRAITDDDIPF